MVMGMGGLLVRSLGQSVAGQSQPSSFSQAAGVRVALFSGNYNYTRDGANLALNRLVAFLERMRIPVRVYSPTGARPAFAHAGDLVSVPSIALPGRGEYRLGLGLPGSVVADLRRFGPTVFHVSAPDLIGCAALRLARAWDLPVIASYHTRFETYLSYYGLAALQPLAMRYLRWFYRSCDTVFAPSRCMADFLRAERFSDDVRLWSRGVDRSLFDPARRDPTWRAAHGFTDDDVVIGFVGRLVREKGLDLLSETVARLEGAGVPVRLLIVGAGPERARLESQLPKAVFTGFLEGEALARAYASADIFLNPSTTETFGNVTLEAMASGLVPVCAAASGSSSLVSHDATGFTVAPSTPESFAAAIASLVRDRARRAAMGRAAREASAAYQWDEIMRGLVEGYREALARRGSARREDELPGPPQPAFGISAAR
jgi:glycosyltransferase involved in cell wall biosynthesis